VIIIMIESKTPLIDENSLKVYYQRCKVVHALNFLMVLYCLTQVALYIAESATAQCKEGKLSITVVQNMGVGFIITYGMLAVVPIMVGMNLQRGVNAFAAVGYVVVMIVVKVILVVVLVEVGWRHIGQCYIHETVKSTIIATAVFEMLIMLIYIYILLSRRSVDLVVKELRENVQLSSKPLV
jgi:hypothetical protein